MRQLSLSEITTISGGSRDDLYTFGFIVSNTLWVGLLWGLFIGKFETGAMVGASYAGLRLVAQSLDNYYFPEGPHKVTVTHVEASSLPQTV